jgi:hypothetical protein
MMWIMKMTHLTARIHQCVFLCPIALATSCVALLETKEKSINNTVFPQYWLTTSMYAGPFYDNNTLTLMDHRPFFAIDDVQTSDGFIVYPPNPDRTIPAGSLVKIISVSYPDKKVIDKRPIFSPREHIWVYLLVAKERGRVSIFHEKTHILVVPKSVIAKKQLRGYLARFFSKNDPNYWILKLESHIQNGIFNKHPTLGMKKEHVLATLGPAQKKQFYKKGDYQESQEIWYYPDYFIVMVNNTVNKVKNLSRKISDLEINPHTK